jgi:hypothetical protein
MMSLSVAKRVAKAAEPSKKYTPGPWAQGNKQEYGTYSPNTIFGADGAAIASCYGIALHRTLEELDSERNKEGLANAKLIACAPEMAEMLREYLDNGHITTPAMVREVLVKAGVL